jgi:hypothetical protein
MTLKFNSKDMCHWAACQQSRVLGSSLCGDHEKTCLALNLRIWPGPAEWAKDEPTRREV